MKRFTAILCLAVLLLSGCAAKEETTLTGIVVSVEGTQVELMQMGSNTERPQRPEGEMPTRPDGMEDSPDGTRPARPEGGNGSDGGFANFGDASAGEEVPAAPDGQLPTLPDGETIPEGEMPTGPEGGFGGRGEGSDRAESKRETVTVDLADAHITVEFDGGKATGSMEDITRGVFLTVTMVDGKATKAVVSENSGFGGRGQGSKPQNGNRPSRDSQTADSTIPTQE